LLNNLWNKVIIKRLYKISNEHDELLRDLEIWETLKEKKVSVSERLRLARLGKDLDILVKKRAIEIPKMKAERPILILILSRSGRIILSNPFIAEMTVEDAYIGKFLTFFNTFTNQIFSESFDRVKFGQYTALFNTVNSFFVVYMFHGQTYGARLKLIQFFAVYLKDMQLPSELEFEIADIQALMKYKLSESEFYNKLKDILIQGLAN